MVVVVVILEKVYPIFEFVAFEIDVEIETVLPTVGGVAFDMKVVAAENNFDKAENIPDPGAAAAADVDVGPAAAAVSYYSS